MRAIGTVTVGTLKVIVNDIKPIKRYGLEQKKCPQSAARMWSAESALATRELF